MYALLLNSTYEPLKVISWKKAITMYFNGKIEIIDSYEREIRSIYTKFRCPAVVRLVYFVKPKKYQRISLSKDNIFFRDNYTCLYCGKEFSRNELTIDHIIPLSHGGQKSWENLATACYKCNNRKGNFTLEQTGFKLIKKPRRPLVVPGSSVYLKIKEIPDKWKDYLYF